jgi:hypothetical protein
MTLHPDEDTAERDMLRRNRAGASVVIVEHPAGWAVMALAGAVEGGWLYRWSR